MKLLTPQEVKDTKAKELARDILRVKETTDVVLKTRQRLAEAESDFNKTLAKNREKWAEEEESHFKRVKDMESEIDVLEAKKLNALIPLGILKEGTYDKMEDAVNFLTQLRQREKTLDDSVELLENRLDEVGEKEQNLKQLENRLFLREEGIKRQEENIRINNELLTNQLAEFATTKLKAENNITERITAVILKERSVDAKDELNKRNIKALEDKERALIDERETLARAWKELERMKGQISP